MDGKWDKWWLAPVFVMAIAGLWCRRHPRLVMAFLAAVALFLLSGCATTDRLVEVNVPLAVPCQVEEPVRPPLAIDTMPPDLPLDVQVRNLRADHDARDGYEGELRTRLQACRAPLPP